MSVFLYAGQGSQFVGMGKDLAEAYPEFRALAREAELDFDALGLMGEGPAETLSDTRYTQPCMALFAAGVTEVLRRHGITPEAACGLSLGEYGALYAAGVWDPRTYIRLVAFRGAVMAEAARGKSYVMSAVINAEEERVEAICAGVREAHAGPAAGDPLEGGREERFVYPVNLNCPGQIVICGDGDSVEEAETLLKEEARVRITRLKTTSPFHTFLMEPAGRALREKLAAVPFHRPGIPVAMNVTGRLLTEEEDIPELLAEQVCRPVRFGDDLKTLLSEGAEDFIEIGPGSVLAGLCKKTARAMGKKVSIRSIQTAEDLSAVIGEARR